jgi:hypothetical protein
MKKILVFLAFLPFMAHGQVPFSSLFKGVGAYDAAGSPTLTLTNTTASTGKPYYLHSNNSGVFEVYSTPNVTPIFSLSNLGDATLAKRLVLTQKWGATGSGNELLGRNSSGGLCKITLGANLTLTDSTLSASGGGGSGWATTGNAGLTSPKLGTTDAVAVSVRTNDVERMGIAADGVLTTTLKDNVSSGGTIGSTGLTNLVDFVTTDAAEKVDVNGTLEASTLVTESANNATTKQVVRITTGGTVALPAGIYDGEVKTLVNKSGGAVTIDPTSTITILGASTYSLADGNAITVRYVSGSTDWEMYSVGATSLPASAGGSSGQVQYNSGGSLAGNASFTYAPGATTGDEVLITANSISSGNGLDVTSNSTAATGNTQTLAKIALSGANASSSQTTYALDVGNTHTGTTSTNVGIRANASGGTDNYSILLGANTAQNIYGARRTSDAGGSDLRIQAGGSFAGGSNRAGGNLLLSSGISTGSTGSEIQFLTATNSGSGTTDRNPTLKAVINRSGFFGLNMSSPSYLLDAQSGQYRFCLGGTSYTPASVATVSIQNTGSSFAYAEVRNSTTASRIGTNSTYAGALAADGAGGFAFYTSTGPSPGSVYRRMLVPDNGGQPRAFLGGSTTAEGAETYVSSGLFSATGTATVANTTTETTLLGTVNGTKTLPANLFTAGKKVTVRVTGTIANTATPTINIKLKFGSTTIAETTATTITAVSGTRRFVAEFEVTCRSTGASGTLQAGGEFRYFTSATGQSVMEAAENLVSSFNTTTTHTVDVTATWGTADAANTISGTQATLIIED